MKLKIGKTAPKGAKAAVVKEATPDQLKAIRQLAERGRDLEKLIEKGQEALSVLSEEYNSIFYNKLPTMMSEANLDRLGMPAKGSLPAVDLELKPYYSAVIAASWPEEKRREAFDYLISIKAGDLIKTEVVAQYGRGNLKEAQKLAKVLSKKKNVSSVLKETVHSGTLSSWFKDQVENKNFTPNLEKIGGSMGFVVKPKARKA